MLSVLLYKQYRYIRQLNYIVSHGAWLNGPHVHQPATAGDASSTQAWMTFDYINHVYMLPDDYMKNALTIQDARYPRLTIAALAKVRGEAIVDTLKATQAAIAAYLSAHPTTK